MGEISIHNLKFDGHKITNNIVVSKDLEKYVKSPMMFIEYDDDISADDSILNIPLIATVLPLAWITGSDIHVDKLDKRFKESMESLQRAFSKKFPNAPFTTEINAGELVDNKIGKLEPRMRTGLLFSGGVDSMYSLITNLHLKPRLIMHWGVEGTPYPMNSEYWELVRSTYDIFSKNLGLPYHLTKTNALTLLHNPRIEHDLYKELYYGSLWVRLQHSPVLLSLTAPLSIKRFDQLLIAATRYPQHPRAHNVYHPHSQAPETDEQIGWADLRVKHDGYIPRYKKIRTIAEYLKKDRLTLRVCLDRRKAPNTLNCNDCSKCIKTIAQLVQAETDPNICGLKVDRSTYGKMKSFFIHHSWSTPDTNTQKLIPDKIKYDLHGSKEFFEWFRDFKPKEKNVWAYRRIYHMLPYKLARVLDKFYSVAGINIHEHSPHLTEKIINDLEAARAIL
jgi:hypothetical protein